MTRPSLAFQPAIVESDDALEAIYRLRYDVYIAEQGKRYAHADHERRRFKDDSDGFAGVHVLIMANGRPCATVRALHLGDPRSFDAYRTTLHLSEFADWPRASLVVCSRLAVLPGFRGGAAARAAIMALYRHELGQGILFAFHFCAPRLVPLFRRYGFREYLPPFDDPVIGRAHRMVLLLDDLAHLERVGSPLLPVAQQRNRDPRATAWFAARFSEPS